MSTIKVNAITNLSGSGDVEVQLPLKLKEASEPSAPSDGHGALFVDSADNALKYRHTSINSGNSVNISSAIGVSLSSANTFTRGQLIDGGTASDIQLRVQGHASQSVDIASVEKSDGTTCLEVTSAGVVGIPLTTASSSTTTGALTIGGGLGVAGDIWVGDDIVMDSDAAVLKFGADNEVTLTHVHNTGLLLNSNMQLQFRDSTEYIYSNSDGYLTTRAATGLNLNIAGTATLAVVAADVSLANGVGLNLYEDITFLGATTENLIKMPDNLADALHIKEGSTSYIQFTTTNSSELITFGQNVNMNGNILDNAILQSYKETVAAGSATTGAVTYDLANGNVFFTELTGNITSVNFDNEAVGHSWAIIFKQDDPARTFSWTDGSGDETIKWIGGSAPDGVTTTVGETSIFTFIKANSTIYGMTVGQGFAA